MLRRTKPSRWLDTAMAKAHRGAMTHPYSPFHRYSALMAAAMVLLMVFLAALAPVAIARERDVPGATPAQQVGAELTVTHGPIATTLTNPGSDGHQLGDL